MKLFCYNKTLLEAKIVLKITEETHQKDLNGSKDVHGSSEGGA